MHNLLHLLKTSGIMQNAYINWCSGTAKGFKTEFGVWVRCRGKCHYRVPAFGWPMLDLKRTNQTSLPIGAGGCYGVSSIVSHHKGERVQRADRPHRHWCLPTVVQGGCGIDLTHLGAQGSVGWLQCMRFTMQKHFIDAHVQKWCPHISVICRDNGFYWRVLIKCFLILLSSKTCVICVQDATS